jgi:N-acetylglucosamine malate deacetylase 1
MSGQFEFAEGWRKHLHLGFCSDQVDPLRAALAGTVCEAAE